MVAWPASSRNLLANPFNCNCQLAWLGGWLRKRKIVTGNPRCQNPDFLRQIPLQDVAFPDFRCEEGNSWPPGGEAEGALGPTSGVGQVRKMGWTGSTPWHALEGRGLVGRGDPVFRRGEEMPLPGGVFVWL